ncbi:MULTISPECIES: SDR family NAD(P)-dependent oxidoreductase [Pandoraea]|uniref:3-oxoacyl-ACP reductase n=1 Tax=Pandoraea cepalis TaxID=2508294 RepID=A0AAW7MH68_9BURK|nr:MULTISPECIES: glucose 1-dehydrogenase [Pandoraea]ALS65159.1 short-chain dehydrogenase [Pandoraea apista]MDN4572087.1 3-oxoacyl-ACP reductase [Pandoraea cepalis]MDN4576743.1 3-oxoacyl-ACP reductase [Pandoraea cepalis]RRW92396.1 glucose 1-dehydrogenase [Pandoraea apista]CFB65558.1 3-oxoacyl-[acyl-carrier-protein] reductase FabG [Pandoraea apista]
MTDAGYRLDDKVAFITAGANGLGEAAAMAIARFGGKIAFLDIDKDNGERVARALQATGTQALFVEANVLDTEAINDAVERTVKTFGHIDILVNNAGGVRKGDFLSQPEKSWRKHIDMNLVSMLAATQVVAHVMIGAKRGGTIINISSSEGLRAAPGYAVYAACKAGMVSFTRSMALELAPHDIRTHVLAPDMIATAGLRRFVERAEPAENAARDRYIPMGRMGRVEEFGNVIAFLASDMASYLNGVLIPVDGGTIASSGWTRNVHGDDWALFHG